MNVFEHRGLRLEYEVRGEGEPLVFLHGMGGSIEQIRTVYDEIPGVRLICLNQQGHGGSDADLKTLSFDRMGEDVTALLDHLQIKDAAFAGISMGAAVCLNVATRFPSRVKRLLLIRNAWTWEPMNADVQQAFTDLGRCLMDGGALAFQKTRGWEIVKEPSAYTRQAFLNPFESGVNAYMARIYQTLPYKTPVPNAEILTGVTMPVTILACKNDLCHPFSFGLDLNAKIKGSLFLEIPDKDKDEKAHRSMVNEAVQRMMRGENIA